MGLSHVHIQCGFPWKWPIPACKISAELQTISTICTKEVRLVNNVSSREECTKSGIVSNTTMMMRSTFVTITDSNLRDKKIRNTLYCFATRPLGETLLNGYKEKHRKSYFTTIADPITINQGKVPHFPKCRISMQSIFWKKQNYHHSLVQRKEISTLNQWLSQVHLTSRRQVLSLAHAHSLDRWQKGEERR